MGELTSYSSVKDFLRDCEDYLLQREVQNNLILGIVYSLNENEDAPMQDVQLLSVKYKGKVMAVCLYSRNRPIISATTYEEKDIKVLSGYFKDKAIEGVFGETLYADIFARSRGGACHVSRRLRVHVLGSVPSSTDHQQKFAAATLPDLPVLAKFLQAYEKETGHAHSMLLSEAQAVIEKQIQAENLFVWRESGGIVCMAAILRFTRNYGVIGNVYTPPFSRNQGYAHHCVTGLSRLIFQRGYRGSVLFTDQTNPVSEKVYSDIGYEPVSEFCEVSFRDPLQF